MRQCGTQCLGLAGPPNLRERDFGRALRALGISFEISTSISPHVFTGAKLAHVSLFKLWWRLASLHDQSSPASSNPNADVAMRSLEVLSLLDRGTLVLPSASHAVSTNLHTGNRC